MTFGPNELVNPTEGWMKEGYVVDDAYEFKVMLWDKFWNTIYSPYYINEKLQIKLVHSNSKATGYYYAYAPNPIDADVDPGFAYVNMYTNQSGVVTMNTGYNFYDNGVIVNDLKFVMNPGPPSAARSIASVSNKYSYAGDLLTYTIHLRDMYDNILDLTESSSIDEDAYTIEFDLPAAYNYTTKTLEEWNALNTTSPQVVRTVVDNIYYEYTLNFTRKGKTFVRALLYGEELIINNGWVTVFSTDPTNDLVLRKKEGD